jgi:hypothetical protein
MQPLTLAAPRRQGEGQLGERSNGLAEPWEAAESRRSGVQRSWDLGCLVPAPRPINLPSRACQPIPSLLVSGPCRRVVAPRHRPSERGEQTCDLSVTA